MSCGCNGAITNQGAKLIGRALNESKHIVFSGVRMNTVYENDLMSLVQKPETWFGANVGEVVGCLSHIIIDEVSHVCDAKVAVQCNDNSKAWKTIGIYGHLEGESNDTLIYCESIQNGDFKGTTVVELPVTLDGAVDDFGFSQGGGGGGDVPANMMTTDTEQQDLSGMKQWELQAYIGGASAENPDKYDLLNVSHAEIGNLSYYNVDGRPVSYPVQCSNIQQFYDGDTWVPGTPSYAKLSPLGVLQLNAGETFDGEHTFLGGESVEITPNSILYENPDTGASSATWAAIIEAANGGGGGGGSSDISSQDDVVQDDGEGGLSIFGELIQPDYSMSVDGLLFNFDSSGYLASVSSYDSIATISVLVVGVSGAPVSNGRVNGLSRDANSPLVFSSPIQLQEGYHVIYQVIRSVV